MQILVTGGNGFIGSHVVKQLVASGHTVRCSLRPKSSILRLRGLPYEKVIADVRNRFSILEAVNGCDAVIHCASLSNWKDLNSPELESIILEGTQNVIDATIAQDARLVYVSSAAALGASDDPLQIRTAKSDFNLNPKLYRYAYLKSEAEKLCEAAIRQQNADIIRVHPAETYGPGDTHYVTASTLIEFANGPLCLTTEGGTSVAHVDDVAAGIVAACEKGVSGEKYMLGGENCTISKLAAITQELCGTRHREVKIPKWMLRFVAFCFRHSPFVKAQTLATKYLYATHFWYFDNRPTLEALGVEFRSAEATLKSTIQWLKQRPDAIRTPRH